MKKSFVAFSLFLLTFASVFANTENTSDYGYYYGKGQSFNFMEKNVHFNVYQNGEFDFFIKQPGVNIGVNLGNVNITFNSGFNYDNYVLYDDYGAIIQIEDIPIYYDYYGRISRIGNTYIRYQNRRLIQFGGLYVHYNYSGYYESCSGYINLSNRYYNYRPYLPYFARPIYTHCIVSYEPYRRSYHPVRYRYNSVEFRRRARNNSYYRSSSNRVVRRQSIPRRVAPRTRTTVRRTNTITRNTAKRTNPVRRSANLRTLRSTRSIRRNTPSTRSNQTRVQNRRTNTVSTRNHRVENTPVRRRSAPTRASNSTIKSGNTRSNIRRTNANTRSSQRSISKRSTSRKPVSNRLKSHRRGR